MKVIFATDFDGGGTDRSSHRKHKKYKKKRRSRAEREGNHHTTLCCHILCFTPQQTRDIETCLQTLHVSCLLGCNCKSFCLCMATSNVQINNNMFLKLVLNDFSKAVLMSLKIGKTASHVKYTI